MKVLVACEYSGRVRDAFLRRGHDAMSCDLLPTDVPGPHYQGDVRDILHLDWDLLIGHPECTYMTNSGVHWLFNRKIDRDDMGVHRWPKLFQAASFFRLLWEAKHIKRVCLENPIPHKYAAQLIGIPYSQIIQPWQFGHKEMKGTCLWLRGLDDLQPTDVVGPPPKDRDERKSWARIHNLPPSEDRWKIRSETYSGIAEAMAEQWGGNLQAAPRILTPVPSLRVVRPARAANEFDPRQLSLLEA